MRYRPCWFRGGFSTFDETTGFVEFKRELDLCLIKRREGCIYFLSMVLLQFFPSRVTTFSQEFNENTFSAFQDQGTGSRRE
jgi:hypothetical protein